MVVSVRSDAHNCRRRKFLNLKMLGEYIDTAIAICIVIYVVDLLLRFYYVATEYFLHSQCYLSEDRLITICKRAFTCKKSSIWLTLGILLTILIRVGSSTTFAQLMPSKEFFCFMPLYWLFQTADLSHSSLSYARWIRETHGLDYAAGMASNYYHGYLKIALAEVNGDGLKKRIQKYEDSKKVHFGMDRLFILMPTELFVNGIIESPLLEMESPLKTKRINRAGVKRTFKHAVYKLTRQINGTTYYLALEGATPMLSFFEAMSFQKSTTWQMQEMKREIWFKFYKHLKELLHSPETRNTVELVLYSSHKPNGNLVDVGEILYARIQAHVESILKG